ncbi:MAG: hypothetical protein M1826_000355 [Phylliscum demangeonii]|nr:MAG: hypothetical protein M1826_000355 [Phylliscum demangeonii]
MVGLDGGIDCPTVITLVCNHRRFVVEVARATFSVDPPQLGTATEAEAEEIHDEAVASLADSLMMLLQPFYRELAPFRDQLALDELFQPFCFTLSIDGKVLQRDPARKAIGQPPLPGIDLGSVPQSVRRICPKDVIVLRELMADNVCKMSVHGEIMCYKKGGWDHASLVREYTALKELLDHGLPYRIRVPLLKGTVVWKDEEPIMALGVLMTYIDPDPPQYTLSHVKGYSDGGGNGRNLRRSGCEPRPACPSPVKIGRTAHGRAHGKALNRDQTRYVGKDTERDRQTDGLDTVAHRAHLHGFRSWVE